jgi:hypothetical protein
MSRKHKEKSIEGPFVPLLKETMTSLAWRTMSPYARLLYIAIKTRYSFKMKNNGRIYLSARTAAEETGLHKTTLARCFHELQHYGFIVMTEPGCLGVGGKGKAPHWRLTELGYMSDPPTRDFLRWDGEVFHYQKNRIPSRHADRLSRQSGHTTVPPGGQLAPELSRQSGHTADPPCPARADISSLTTPVPRERPRGHRREWRTPTVVELVWSEWASVLPAIVPSFDRAGHQATGLSS